jgi:hypothetical protein
MHLRQKYRLHTQGLLENGTVGSDILQTVAHVVAQIECVIRGL